MDRYDDIWRALPGRRSPRGGPDRWAGPPRGRPRRYAYEAELGPRRYDSGFRGYARSYDRGYRRAPWGDQYRDDGYDRGFGGGRRRHDPRGYGGAFPDPYISMRHGAPGAQHDLAGADDAWIHEAVRYSLLQDGYLDAQAIQVEVDAGVVTLRGEVQDYMQARYAWDDAWDAPGVVGVVSRLVVSEAPGAATGTGEQPQSRPR